MDRTYGPLDPISKHPSRPSDHEATKPADKNRRELNQLNLYGFRWAIKTDYLKFRTCVSIWFCTT